MNGLITESWLKQIGFRPHSFGGEPNQHWLLWLSPLVRDGVTRLSDDDIGIEVSFGRNASPPWWFCWLRKGQRHTHDHFIHLRHIRRKRELVALVEAIIGRRWYLSSQRNPIMITERAPMHVGERST